MMNPTANIESATATNAGFKQTEVGWIPVDWEVVPLGDIVDLLTGYPFPSSKYASEGTRLLRCSNIKRGVTDWSIDLTKYWPNISGDLNQYVLHSGDIVIAMDGSLVGRSFAQLSKGDLPALLLQRVARLRTNKADINYLKHHVCSQYFTFHCDSVKTASAIPHISPSDIREFQIPLPPTLAEQTAIATALSDMDALIQAQEELLAKKRALKQGAMQELLRPKEGWVVKRLGEVFTFHKTANNSRAELSTEGSVLYLHYGDIHTKWRNFLNLKKVQLPYIDYERVRQIPELKNGDLVLADASEDYEGIGACVEIQGAEEISAVAGLHTLLLRGDGKFLADGFKGYFKDFCGVQEQLRSNANGVSVYGISKNSLKDFNLYLPPLAEQTRIANILSDMDTEIEQLEAQLSKYRQLKVGMMQELLTGKKRLV